MNRFSVLALLASVGAWTATAQAQLVEYSFTGHVSSIYGGGSFYGVTPQAGDPVIGFLRYDLSSINDSADPQTGRYAQLSPAAFDILLDSAHISNDGKFFTYVQNDNGGADGFTAADGESVSDAGDFFRVNGISQIGTLEFSLSTFTQNPFSSVAQPANLNLSNFTFRQGEVGTGTSGALFTLDTLSRVPEPSASLLLLTTSVLFASRRKRK